jgi:outer membrane protein assembly factor BamA
MIYRGHRLVWPLLQGSFATLFITVQHSILRASYWKPTLAACITLIACMPVRGIAHEHRKTGLTIETLRCEGNETTPCHFILGYLYLVAGDPVDEDEIQSATLRLSRLRNFKQVDIHLEKGSQRGKVILVVAVKEARAIATQSALGVASVGGGTSTVLTGRITNVNLFGKGKILDLLAQTQVPLAGPTQQATSARLEYVDPQLLGAGKDFFGASLSYLDSHQRLNNGVGFDAHVLDASVSLGHRFGMFSYVTASYDYRFVSNVICHFGPGDGPPQTDRSRGRVLVTYGWSSDDPYFPTHGSQLQVTAGKSANGCEHLSLHFLKTWAVADQGYLSVGVQQLSVAVTYAHDFTASLGSPSAQRARWYVQPGVWYLGYSTQGERDWEAGMRAGVRIETSGLGIVDFFVFGVTDWHRSIRP